MRLGTAMPRPTRHLLLAAALLAQGCSGGGGDLDHPRTLDAMVQEAREVHDGHPTLAPPRLAAPVGASAPG